MKRSVVSIITLTKSRFNLLLRAMHSVKVQDYDRPIEYIVIGDDCPELTQKTDIVKALIPGAIVENVRSKTVQDYLPSKLAQLRNRGIDLASGQYICFLDDDNEFAPNHVSSLIELIETNQFDVVHSYRYLYHSDCRPYVERLLPWGSSLETARKIYDQFVGAGIFVPGTNFMRDRMFDGDFPEFNVRGTVDTSEWLIPATLLAKFRFPSEFTSYQQRMGLSEDNLLLNSFAAADLNVGTTGLPTLLYYLGGFSNHLISELTKTVHPSTNKSVTNHLPQLSGADNQ